MKAKWIIVSLAGAAVAATWGAAAIAYFFFEPSRIVWAALVTAAAVSLEGFFWVCAGMLGWSVLAGRRATLMRLKQRFFPQRGAQSGD